MNISDAIAIVGGHVKPGGWRTFVRPHGWDGRSLRPTRHLLERCRERTIPPDVVRAFLDRADLVLPLADGLMKLGLSRRAASRVGHDRRLGPRAARQVARLTLVVAAGGELVTAWYGCARRHRPRQASEDGSPAARPH